MADKPIYYGSHSVAPKGSRFASMKEAAESGQVRRFGLYKIDRKTIEDIKDEKSRNKSLEDLMVDLASLVGKKRNLTSKIKFEKDDVEKAKLKLELARVTKSKDLIDSKIKALKAQNK